MIAPAMNVHMYENPITQDNMARLRTFGISFIEPDAGYLACGEVGKGRLPDPELIVARVLEALDAPDTTSEPQVLAGKRVMITGWSYRGGHRSCALYHEPLFREVRLCPC